MAPQSGSSDLGSLRIVATDDDPEMLGLLVSHLRNAGHRVFAAYDGQAACELAVILKIDLLITNTRLFDLDATELIRQVRRVRPDLAILHIGQPLPSSSPFADVPTLAEPFTAAALEAAIAGLLGGRLEARGQ